MYTISIKVSIINHEKKYMFQAFATVDLTMEETIFMKEALENYGYSKNIVPSQITLSESIFAGGLYLSFKYPQKDKHGGLILGIKPGHALYDAMTNYSRFNFEDFTNMKKENLCSYTHIRVPLNILDVIDLDIPTTQITTKEQHYSVLLRQRHKDLDQEIILLLYQKSKIIAKIILFGTVYVRGCA